MPEWVKRFYSREEEFLDEFRNSAAVATALLDGLWTPDADCDDSVRQQRQYFFSTGEMSRLVFDSAVVFYAAQAFSSVRIVLRSSRRIVAIRINWQGSDLVAEKIVDKAVDDVRTN